MHRQSALLLTIPLLFTLACSKTPQATKQPPAKPSEIKLTSPEEDRRRSQLRRPNFACSQAGTSSSRMLLSNKLSLDEPAVGVPADSDYVVADGKEVRFVLEFDKAQTTEAIGKNGRGKRIEIPAHPLGPAGTNLQRTLVLEAYDDFPNLLLSTVSYKNTGTVDVPLQKTVAQRHRLSAKLIDAKAQPYDLWSYQGSTSCRAPPR